MINNNLKTTIIVFIMSSLETHLEENHASETAKYIKNIISKGGSIKAEKMMRKLLTDIF